MINYITKYAKIFLPKEIRAFIRLTNKLIIYNYRFYNILFNVKFKNNLKIIVGAAESYQKGWYSTNQQWLDIRNTYHWQKIFNSKIIITNVVAEHVFEHLTYDECIKSLRIMNKYMKKNAKIRIAVPDGYNPDRNYIKNVCINGIGDDAQDHKQLLNKDILFEILNKANFKPILIEGYDKNKNLTSNKFFNDEGFIRRSRQNKDNNLEKIWGFKDSKTSLIVDGIKN
ncbi:hypothetical protein OA415_06105 [Pelagibacteraceae bacterium]|nr:hypothetical protein [Pelagibacteraceae bacterium]